VIIGLERGADLHMAQLMPLPVTVSCISKIQIGLPFWYRLTRVVPDNRPLNGCVCVCVLTSREVCLLWMQQQQQQPVRRSWSMLTRQHSQLVDSMMRLLDSDRIDLAAHPFTNHVR